MCPIWKQNILLQTQSTSNPLETTLAAPHGAEAFARPLDGILACVLGVLANRFRQMGAFGPDIRTRFSRNRRRLASILGRLAAGRYPQPRAPNPDAIRPDATRPDAIGRAGGPPPPRLPRRPAWVVHMIGYQVAGYGSQLQYLLNDPATAATLAAAPPHAAAALARSLRPLCRMLGITLPAILQPAPLPPRVRPPRPKQHREKPTRLPPLLPLAPQHRPRQGNRVKVQGASKAPPAKGQRPFDPISWSRLAMEMRGIVPGMASPSHQLPQ